MSAERVLLVGGSGQVGRALQAWWRAHRPTVMVEAPSSRALSLEHPAAVAAAVHALRPAVVVNCAAYTRVDDAEQEPARAAAVNAEGAGALAAAAAAVGARLVHLSTDYVFDGRSGAPYAPDAPTNPLGVYGRTKRAGELAVLAAHPGAVVLRTAWVHSATPPNFVATAVRRLREGRVMRVVSDQVGTPTRAATLARVIDAVVRGGRGEGEVLVGGSVSVSVGVGELGGVLHATDSGVASWYDVACAVYELLGARGALGDGAGVVPVPTSEVVRPAPRPVMGVLDCHATWRALGFAPPHWRVGVAATVDELLGELRGALPGELPGELPAARDGDTAPRGGAHG